TVSGRVQLNGIRGPPAPRPPPPAGGVGGGAPGAGGRPPPAGGVAPPPLGGPPALAGQGLGPPDRIYKGPRNSRPSRMFDFNSTSEIAASRSLTTLRYSSFGSGPVTESTTIILGHPMAAANAASSASCGSSALTA